jgi:hypothetical protein
MQFLLAHAPYIQNIPTQTPRSILGGPMAYSYGTRYAVRSRRRADRKSRPAETLWLAAGCMHDL